MSRTSALPLPAAARAPAGRLLVRARVQLPASRCSAPWRRGNPPTHLPAPAWAGTLHLASLPYHPCLAPPLQCIYVDNANRLLVAAMLNRVVFVYDLDDPMPLAR